MDIVNPLHRHYRPEHLAHVIAEMVRRGPPVINAHKSCARIESRRR